MENWEKEQFAVIVTNQAERRFYRILDYLYEHYNFDRAEQIADEIFIKSKSLIKFPFRGAIERSMSSDKKEYRFILYERSSRAQVKIIYFIKLETKEVFIVDFSASEWNNKY